MESLEESGKKLNLENENILGAENKNLDVKDMEYSCESADHTHTIVSEESRDVKEIECSCESGDQTHSIKSEESRDIKDMECSCESADHTHTIVSDESRNVKEIECSCESADQTHSIKSEESRDVKDMECSCESADQTPSVEYEDSEERLLIKKAMLDHLSANDKVFFKSFKENEEDLEKHQKIVMAEEILHKNYGLFLAKFGNHLLMEHLSYFENRSEEDSLIVDLHLKQLRKALELPSSRKPSTQVARLSDDKMDVAVEQSTPDESVLSLRNRLLDYLSLSKDAHFKSQQVGEPDLSQWEKRDIAEEVLNRSSSMFLSRFGTHLLEEHLVYFDQEPGEKSYEIEYYLKRLRKTNCKEVTRVGIKNRRFEALKKMVEEGSYFGETEMRNRNPLLYEQLVGRFLTADERRERLNNIDTTNITFVNLLLEQMDRDAVKKLRKEQEEAEEDAMEEEEEEYSFHEQMEEEDDSEEDNDLDKTMWGEEYTDEKTSGEKKLTFKNEIKKCQVKVQEGEIPELSDSEKRLLMEEFRSSMFSSFLNGKDTDFDYSKVDYNSDYDDLEVQGQDEEDRYFDEESSEDVSSHKNSDEEDLLDQYMKKLKPEPTTEQLADQICSLTH